MPPLGWELRECTSGEAGIDAKDDDAAEPAKTRRGLAKRVRANLTAII